MPRELPSPEQIAEIVIEAFNNGKHTLREGIADAIRIDRTNVRLQEQEKREEEER